MRCSIAPYIRLTQSLNIITDPQKITCSISSRCNSSLFNLRCIVDLAVFALICSIYTCEKNYFATEVWSDTVCTIMYDCFNYFFREFYNVMITKSLYT